MVVTESETTSALHEEAAFQQNSKANGSNPLRALCAFDVVDNSLTHFCRVDVSIAQLANEIWNGN